MPDQYGALDAAHVQVGDNSAGVGGESAGRKLTGPVSRPVCRDGVKLGGQPPGNLMPVSGRAWLTMQQHQLVNAEPAWSVNSVSVGGHRGVLSGRCPLGWPVAQRGVVLPALAVPEEEEHQPSGGC